MTWKQCIIIYKWVRKFLFISFIEMRILNRQNKRLLIIVGIVWAVLLALFVVRLYLSVDLAGESAKRLNLNHAIAENVTSGWDDMEVRNLNKEIIWLEQQVLLSKSDSFSIGINLQDSIVQVQLKGAVLLQSKILKQKRNHFLDEINQNTYLNIFGHASLIEAEVANLPKKPIKKVMAPGSDSIKTEVESDTIKVERLNWQFHTSNNINVVINGVQLSNDSVINVPERRDILKYQMYETLHGIIPRDYSPTLFLWLNDIEAKTIYRALPANAKVIFRN